MNKLLFLLLLPVTLLAQPTPDFAIRFDQKAFVRVTYRNNPRPRPVSVSTFNILPAFDNPEQIDTLLPGQGSRLFSLPVRSLQKGYWQLGDIQYDLYLLPADTVNLAVDFRQDTTWRDTYLTFTGPNASYQELYRQLNLQVLNLSTKRASAAGSAPTLTAYQRIMDSLRKAEDHFFINYTRKQSLPGWFVRDVDLQLHYQDAAYRENAVTYRRFANKGKIEPIPATYFNYHQKAVVANPKAQHLSAYWQFINDYLFLKSGRPIGQASDSTWMRKDFARAQQTLGLPLAEFYKAITLSAMAKFAPTEAMPAIKKWAPTFQNRALVNVITADALSRIKVLKPGDTAPNFVLPDLSDSLTSLKSFQGNVVLLCFWFPGCKPCVEEFPHENKLVDTFENKPVRIVGICTNANQQSWQRAVQKYGLKTLNLFANASWQKTLESKYAITGYPHYVLIDQQGRVVRNFASRPSEKAATEISQLFK